MRNARTLFAFFATLSLFTNSNTPALVLPESSIDQPIIGADAQSQSWPAVAFNGSVYVVVWQDEQPDTGVSTRFARFDQNGQPLGGMQTLPVTGAHNAEIASNGKDFLLIWRYEASPTQSFAARLDGDGNFVPNSVIGPVGLGDFPKVASNGADYMIFAASPRSAATRVTAAGFGAVNYTVSPDLGVSANIASDGDGYLAVWIRPRDGALVGARISAAGFWVEPAPFQIAGAGAQNPSVAFSNGMYLALWQASTGQSTDLFARRIPSTGPPIDATPLRITTTGTAANSAVGPYGDGFRVISYRFDYNANQIDLRTFPISTNGVIGIHSVLQNLDSAAIQQLAITAHGTNAMVAWTAFSSETHYDAFARFIPANGPPGETQILQPGPNVETAPAIASGANGYLVVWQDNRNSTTNRDDIYGRFVDAYGHPKGAPAIPIARGALDETSPAAAAAGDHYLVAWREANVDSPTAADIKAALLINDTVVKELTICAVTNDQRAVAVASNGRDFLVVWRDSRTIGYNSDDGLRYGDDDIYGLHITHDGELSGPLNGFPICKAAGEQMAPVIASNGTNYLVVWRDARSAPGPDRIFGAIVNPGETNTPSEIQICFGDSPQRAPEVASNGRDYFVVWRDARNLFAPRTEVYGTPISATGKVADTNGIPLLPPSDRQREPAIASVGDDYVLAWLELTSAFIPTYNAFARTIHDDGSVGPSPVELNTTGYDQDTLVFAADRETGIGLMASQTATPTPRVKIQSVCLSNCPILLTATTTADGRTLIWNAQANQTYRIEFKNTLNDPSWQLLQQVTVVTEDFSEVHDNSVATTRFYRIVRP